MPRFYGWTFGFRFSRRNSLAVVAIFAVALSAWAADPWKKDYKSWTQDDVEKILYESPWVKMVEVDAPWLKGSMHYLTPLPSDCDGRPDMSRGDRTPTSWAIGDTQSIVIFQVTWQSAHTIRAAKLRSAVLCGRADADRGSDILEEQPDDYIITVHSPDMSPFKGMDEQALIKATSLSPKKVSKKINPESVSIARYGNSGTPYSLTFKFSRKTESGEPLIPNGEKEVDFESQSGKFHLKARFQLQKMMVNGGPDL